MEFEWNDNYTGTASDIEAPDALMLEIVSGLAPGRALDLGCGAGGMLAALAERGWQVTGVDIADRAIASARAALDERGIDAELHVADTSSWTPPETYDLVTNAFALPATRDEQRAMFAMARAAVAPGGTIVLKDFDPQMSTTHEVFANFHLPSVEELLEAFDGFEIERAEVVDTPVHHHPNEGPEELAEKATSWTAALLVARRPA